MRTRALCRAFALVALVLVAWGPAAEAKKFRWSSQGDYQSADPHAVNDGLGNSINGMVYEPLVMRGRNLELIPALAVAWRQTSSTSWQFELRKGVRFHDGTPFTAEDVVFSVKRAQGSTSGFRGFAIALGEPRIVEGHTIEFTTSAPNPILPDHASAIMIMSRTWAQRHNALRSQDFANKEESFTSRNAVGTGPYRLISREPDVQSVFARNPTWWGLADRAYWDGNVEEFAYVPIKRDTTRTAALLSGEIDFVLDPPVQDLERLKQNPTIKVIEAPESRLVFLGMDQHRNELPHSSVKGRNPFKDRRVRQALYQAIDVHAIGRSVMRGSSVPTGILLPNPEAAGMPKDLERRYPHDVQAARKLLAEAGYPDGFEVALDCPNNRYINDEKICLAISAMLSRVGIRAQVNAIPRTLFLPKLLKLELSLYLSGWGTASPDAMLTLQHVVRGRTAEGDGEFNAGNYSDPELDALIDAAKTEMDPLRRIELMAGALRRHHEMVYHIPLHRQTIAWAMRSDVSAVQRANNALQVMWVKLR